MCNRFVYQANQLLRYLKHGITFIPTWHYYTPNYPCLIIYLMYRKNTTLCLLHYNNSSSVTYKHHISEHIDCLISTLRAVILIALPPSLSGGVWPQNVPVEQPRGPLRSEFRLRVMSYIQTVWLVFTDSMQLKPEEMMNLCHFVWFWFTD